MASKKHFENYVKKHLGEMVLDGFEVVRLEGFYDGAEDYYYIFRSIDRGVNKGRYYCSCCISFVPLKKKIKKAEYKNLVRVFNLNIHESVRGDKWNTK